MTHQTHVTFISRENIQSAGGYYRGHILTELIKKNSDLKISWINYQDCNPKIPEHQYKLRHHLKAQMVILIQLLKLRPDIIVCQRFHWHSLCSFLYIRLIRKKFILDLDDWEFSDIPKPGRIQCLRYIMAKSHHLISSTNFWPEFFETLKHPFTIIPTPVPTPTKSLQNQRSSCKRIGWLGTLDKKESLQDLIATLNQCLDAVRLQPKNIQFFILFQGKYAQELFNWHRHLLPQVDREKIVLLHEIPRHKLSYYLSTFHFGLLAVNSLTRYNQSKCPVKLFHYLNHGICPLIFGYISSSVAKFSRGIKIESTKNLERVLLGSPTLGSYQIALPSSSTHIVNEVNIAHTWVKILKNLTLK